MKRGIPFNLVLVLATLLAGVGLEGHVVAQSGDGYDLSWSSVDGGAGSVSGGDYTLTGIAGQPDTGPALSGGDYTLVGGFWPDGAVSYKLYLPLVLRNS